MQGSRDERLARTERHYPDGTHGARLSVQPKAVYGSAMGARTFGIGTSRLAEGILWRSRHATRGGPRVPSRTIQGPGCRDGRPARRRHRCRHDGAAGPVSGAAPGWFGRRNATEGGVRHDRGRRRGHGLLSHTDTDPDPDTDPDTPAVHRRGTGALGWGQPDSDVRADGTTRCRVDGRPRDQRACGSGARRRSDRCRGDRRGHRCGAQ